MFGDNFHKAFLKLVVGKFFRTKFLSKFLRRMTHGKNFVTVKVSTDRKIFFPIIFRKSEVRTALNSNISVVSKSMAFFVSSRRTFLWMPLKGSTHILPLFRVFQVAALWIPAFILPSPCFISVYQLYTTTALSTKCKILNYFSASYNRILVCSSNHEIPSFHEYILILLHIN